MKIKLDLEGKIYDLATTHFSTYGQPPQTSNDEYYTSASGPNLSLTMKSNKIDQSLLDWVMNPRPALKNGKITVYDDDTNNVLKTITFQKGYCSSFSDSIDANSDNYYATASLNLVIEKLTVQLHQNRPIADRISPSSNPDA